jgi:hypothetical protein
LSGVQLLDKKKDIEKWSQQSPYHTNVGKLEEYHIHNIQFLYPANYYGVILNFCLKERITHENWYIFQEKKREGKIDRERLIKKKQDIEKMESTIPPYRTMYTGIGSLTSRKEKKNKI